jgi:hypothetical protein
MTDDAADRLEAATNLVMQAKNVVAAWDRLYALINPRDSFPQRFADLAEDTECREIQWLRQALEKVAVPRDGGER